MTLYEIIERLREMQDLEAKGYEDQYFRKDTIRILLELAYREREREIFGPDMVSNGYVDAGS